MQPGLEGVLTAEDVPAGAASSLDAALAQAQAGGHRAFEAVLDQAEGRVLGLAWRLLGDRDLARDAAQEVFLRVYRALGSYRAGEGGQAWMYRITVNVCADLARKRGPAPVDLDEAHHPASGRTAEEALLHAERRILVRRALAELTPAERAAVVLRDLEGLSAPEAAQVLGVRAVTVRSQASNGRAKLLARMRALTGGGR